MTIGKASKTRSSASPAVCRRFGLTERRPRCERKALLRCLVEKVVLDRGEHDVSPVRIVWRGGAVSELEVKMRVTPSQARPWRGDESAGA